MEELGDGEDVEAEEERVETIVYGVEANEGEIFKVEAKTYSWLSTDGYYLLQETHRKGRREICLSGDQITWICGKLDDKVLSFGSSNRKESKRFQGVVVSVFEGYNKWGTFLSIQIRVGNSDPNFVIVPAGFYGIHWRNFSRWTAKSVASEQSPTPRIQADNFSMSQAPFLSQQTRSWADVVKCNQVKTTSTTNVLKELISVLIAKLDAVMAELSDFRSSVNSGIPARYNESGVSSTPGMEEPAAGVSLQPSVCVEKLALAEKVSSQEITLPVTMEVAPENSLQVPSSLSRKTNGDPELSDLDLNPSLGSVHTNGYESRDLLDLEFEMQTIVIVRAVSAKEKQSLSGGQNQNEENWENMSLVTRLGQVEISTDAESQATGLASTNNVINEGAAKNFGTLFAVDQTGRFKENSNSMGQPGRVQKSPNSNNRSPQDFCRVYSTVLEIPGLNIHSGPDKGSAGQRAEGRSAGSGQEDSNFLCGEECSAYVNIPFSNLGSGGGDTDILSCSPCAGSQAFNFDSHAAMTDVVPGLFLDKVLDETNPIQLLVDKRDILFDKIDFTVSERSTVTDPLSVGTSSIIRGGVPFANFISPSGQVSGPLVDNPQVLHEPPQVSHVPIRDSLSATNSGSGSVFAQNFGSVFHPSLGLVEVSRVETDVSGVDAPVPPDPGTWLGTETGLCPPESYRPRLGTIPATIPATVPATNPATTPAAIPATTPATVPATVPAIFPEFFSENVPASVPTTSSDACFFLSMDKARESKSCEGLTTILEQGDSLVKVKVTSGRPISVGRRAGPVSFQATDSVTIQSTAPASLPAPAWGSPPESFLENFPPPASSSKLNKREVKAGKASWVSAFKRSNKIRNEELALAWEELKTHTDMRWGDRLERKSC